MTNIFILERKQRLWWLRYFWWRGDIHYAVMLEYHSGHKGYDFKLSAETHTPRKDKEQTCWKPEVVPVSTGSLPTTVFNLIQERNN